MSRILGFFSEKTTDTGEDLTTKGDLHGYSSENTRIPISTNNFSLLGDSAQALGLKWAASATSTLTTAGDLLYASGANTLARLAKGTDNQILKMDGSSLNWETVSTGLTVDQATSYNYSSDYSGSSATLGANAIIYGTVITLPSDYSFLRATALECKIGATANGNFKLALWCRKSTDTGYLSCLAWTPKATQAAYGTNTIAKISTIGSSIISPTVVSGTVVLISVITDSASATFFNNGGTGLGSAETYTDNTELTSTHSLANSHLQPELKVYWDCYK